LAKEEDTSRTFPRSQVNESDDTYSSARKYLSRSKWKSLFLLLACCILIDSCGWRQTSDKPHIEFTKVPLAEEGGTPRLDIIEGRVTGAQPGQQIVLYARSGAWYVQPFANQPFTSIHADSTWKSLTHLGTEYAALLVEPEYNPPASVDALPGVGNGVLAEVTRTGEVRMLVPLFWESGWFQLSSVLALVLAILAFYRFRLHQLTRHLNLRFEERLAERTRIAQELHDTLLQGFLSASMQLHLAVDHLPEDSPAKPRLNHVLQLMGQVIEEGRNAVRGLRSSASSGSFDLEQSFSRVQQELSVQEDIDFRVIVEGRPRPLHPIIRDEVYAIGREALVNAFRHARAGSIEIGVEYLSNHLRILVRDDGCGIDPEVLRSGREGHWGLSGMRERADRIGGRLKVRSRAATGTEVELSIPGHVAFPIQSSSPLRWLARLYPRKVVEGEHNLKREHDI
jgi:signal transduction histidine kinase